jgi:hypothetical protein
MRLEFNKFKPRAVSIHLPHLEHHLNKKKISFEKKMLNTLPSIFHGKCKKGVLRTFLSIGSMLNDIPKGASGRKLEGAVYGRCLEVEVSQFNEELLDVLMEVLNSESTESKNIDHSTVHLEPNGKANELNGGRDECSREGKSNLSAASESRPDTDAIVHGGTLEIEATEQEQDEDIRIAYNDGDKAGTQLSNENYDKELSILGICNNL